MKTAIEKSHPRIYCLAAKKGKKTFTSSKGKKIINELPFFFPILSLTLLQVKVEHPLNVPSHQTKCPSFKVGRWFPSHP